MNKNDFYEKVAELNIELTKQMKMELEKYADFLLEYNTHTNLTAIKTKEEVYLKHFYDSMTLTQIADLTEGTLLDIGTGAGFPGLVLAIIYPNLQVSLLDSNNKKIKFLEETIELLNLKNVKIIYSRAEEYTQKNREQYDYVTSRAVAELRILLELNMPALKVNGSFLVMKGNVEEEIKSSENALEKLNAKIETQEEFELPLNGGHRTLLKIKKLKETNTMYPRSYDKIKKKPL